MTIGFIAPKDVATILGDEGFAALADDGYRSDLAIAVDIAAKQGRIGARPPGEIHRLPAFVGAVNRWLPDRRRRVFWVAHWAGASGWDDDALLLAARAGMGESRSLAEAPGHVFDARAWAEWDQLTLSAEDRSELAILVGIGVLVLATGSDAWL